MNDVVVNSNRDEVLEKVIIEGDLSKLTPAQRVEYYKKTCESLGLNPLTRPFEYQRFNGKLVLYARKECTEQLRFIHKVSIYKLEKEKFDDVFVVTAHARTADGKEDVSTGAVNIAALKGEALSNAMMKSETKAKRRVTLSVCGLGLTDESEIDSIPGAKPVHVDHMTGEIKLDQSSNIKTLELRPADNIHANHVVNSDTIVVAPLEVILQQMKDSADINSLKSTFEYAIDKFSNHEESLDKICAVKDECKIKFVKPIEQEDGA